VTVLFMSSAPYSCAMRPGIDCGADVPPASRSRDGLTIDSQFIEKLPGRHAVPRRLPKRRFRYNLWCRCPACYRQPDRPRHRLQLARRRCRPSQQDLVQTRIGAKITAAFFTPSLCPLPRGERVVRKLFLPRSQPSSVGGHHG
jgi:hypothetical protein